jgi:hypothetical protein
MKLRRSTVRIGVSLVAPVAQAWLPDCRRNLNPPVVVARTGLALRALEKRIQLHNNTSAISIQAGVFGTRQVECAFGFEHD